MRHVAWVKLAAMVICLFGFGAACGSGKSAVTVVDEIPDCEPYFAAYSACFPPVAGATQAIDRGEAMRASFRETLRNHPESRSRLASACSSGLSHLRRACGLPTL